MKRLGLVLLILLFATPALCAPTLVPFEMMSDANKVRDTLTLRGCQYVNAYVSAGTATTFTVPTGASFVVFSGTGNYYVNFIGGTAAAPGSSVTDGSASCLNPGSRQVAGMTTISVYAASTIVVTMEWFK